jgi:ABC-type glycerol-3-phosphate transport system substrate-binding protein
MKLSKWLMILMLIACSGLLWASGGQEATMEEGPKEPVQIEFLCWYAQDQDFNDWIDQHFETEHPYIQVEFVKMGAWDLMDKLLVNLTAGTGAGDVVSIVKRRFTKYSSTLRLVDITDEVKDLKKDIPESLWDITVYKGKVYGMALDEAPAVLFFRHDILSDVGYDSIDTWNQYREAGKKLAANGQYIGFRQYPAVNNGLNDFFIYLNSKGGNFFTDDGKVIDPNPKLKETIDYLAKMQFEDKSTKLLASFSQEFWAAYKDGSVATLPGATWWNNFIKNQTPELEGKWTIQPWPKWSTSAPEATGQWGGTVVAVPQYSKHQKEGIELVKWMGGTVEGQLMFAKFNSMYPAYLPTFEDPFFSGGDPYFNGQNVFDMVLPIPTYNQWDWGDMAQIVGKELDLLWSEKQDVEKTYTEIIKKSKSELGR